MNKIIILLILACSTISVVAQTEDSTTWRNVFTDPQLGKLIETALEHNADLRTANLNVEQADAGLRMSSNPQPPSKNDIALKEKIGDAEKEAQRGENRHKEA